MQDEDARERVASRGRRQKTRCLSTLRLVEAAGRAPENSWRHRRSWALACTRLYTKMSHTYIEIFATQERANESRVMRKGIRETERPSFRVYVRATEPTMLLLATSRITTRRRDFVLNESPASAFYSQLTYVSMNKKQIIRHLADCPPRVSDAHVRRLSRQRD